MKMTLRILQESLKSLQEQLCETGSRVSPPFSSVHSHPDSPHTHLAKMQPNTQISFDVSVDIYYYLDNVALQVRTVITLEPGGEVRRRKLKESRNPGLRLGSREDARKLREEIEQKATEGRIRRVKDVDGREEIEKSVGGRGGEVEVRMRKEDGRGFGRAGGGGGGGNPEGRARSWMLPRLSSPAVQVSPGSCHPMKVTNESQIQSKIED